MAKKKRIRINFRLIIDAKDYKKYGSRWSFVSYKIFNESFVSIHEIKPFLTLNKPIYAIYVGFPILELSKLLSKF